jgi:hypothetical protein
MKYINILLFILLILIVILNVYYIFFYRKSTLSNLLKLEKFAFLDFYPDENDRYGESTFTFCDNNPTCTTTYDELEKNITSFNDTYSDYNAHYSLNKINSSSFGYKNFNDIMTNKSLLAYRCLNKSPLELKNILSNANNFIDGKEIPTIYKKIFLYDEETLYSFITDELQKIYESSATSTFTLDYASNKQTSKILGPIYICISQAPYLQYKGEQIKARFDVTNNKNSYYTENIIGGQRIYDMSTGDGNENKISSLYAEILFIFPMYNKIGGEERMIQFCDNEQRMAKFIELLQNRKNVFVHEKLCFLKCNKCSLICGCLNANETVMSNYIKTNLDAADSTIRTYNSTCYNNINQKTNYSIMYFINPYGNINNIYIANTNI